MSAVLVALRNVNKTYGTVTAVNNVSLEVREGEFVTILGPSGSGKTTTLLLIAGFERPTRGEIRIRGRSVTGLPPHKRDIGMVFQTYALFPHMSVFGNVAFPLRMRHVREPELTTRVRQALALVRLEGLEDRYPRQLSGGQQQRVALARALAHRPSLLLMDEPLGALDRRLREKMQAELKAIQRELGVTTLYVTHDQQEALALSDRIAIMNQGDIVQVGSPLDLYDRPAVDFVAGFLGDVNLLEGVVQWWEGGVAGVDLGGLRVRVSAAVPIAVGKRLRLAIRPERLSVAAAPAERSDACEARVRSMVFHGEVVRYILEFPGDVTLKAARPYQGPESVFSPGQAVIVSAAPEDWRVFE